MKLLLVFTVTHTDAFLTSGKSAQHVRFTGNNAANKNTTAKAKIEIPSQPEAMGNTDETNR